MLDYTDSCYPSNYVGISTVTVNYCLKTLIMHSVLLQRKKARIDYVALNIVYSELFQSCT
jgi:hypothetical protein